MATRHAYKVVKGTHSQNGKTYAEGMTVTHTGDLVKAFPQKFIRVGTVAAAAEDADEVDDEDVDPVLPSDEEPVVSSLGEDETGDFPGATAAGIKVFRRGAWYFIAAASSPETQLVEKAMRKADVEAYIQSM